MMVFIGGIVAAFFGIIGILIIIAAWSWSEKRSKGQRDVEDIILTMKGELSLFEKER